VQIIQDIFVSRQQDFGVCAKAAIVPTSNYAAEIGNLLLGQHVMLLGQHVMLLLLTTVNRAMVSDSSAI
jgi:hypothetical protein